MRSKEWASPQGRRARSQGDNKVAGHHHPQQGDSPAMPEQGEQGMSGDSNQGQSQPSKVPSDEAGLRPSQQVRMRARHRYTSSLAQARTKAEGLSLNVAPKQRRDTPNKASRSSLCSQQPDPSLHGCPVPEPAAKPLRREGADPGGAHGALLQDFCQTSIFHPLPLLMSMIKVTKHTSAFT